MEIIFQISQNRHHCGLQKHPVYVLIGWGATTDVMFTLITFTSTIDVSDIGG